MASGVFWFLAMRAGRIVQAIGCDLQVGDDSTIDKCFRDDALAVVGLDGPIPDALRIDDEHGPVFALVKAAGGVDADGARNVVLLLLDFGFQFIAEAFGARCAARAAGMICVSHVFADEEMILKFRHFI